MTNPSGAALVVLVLELLVSSLVGSVLLEDSVPPLEDSVLLLVSPVASSPPEPLPPHPSTTSNEPTAFGQHVRSLFTAGNRTSA